MQTFLAQLADIPVASGWGPPVGLEDRDERHLAKAVGLTQFGVNHVTLRPGARTSRRHWHEGEDEFVHVLSGQVVLIDDLGEHPLGPGACAGFPAGAVNAHCLVNRGDASAELLVVGTRKVGEERIHYPDEPDPGPFSVVRDEAGQRIA